MDHVDAARPAPEDRVAEPLTEYIQRFTRRVRGFDRRRPLVWDLHLTGFWLTAALIDLSAYLNGGRRYVAHNLDVPSGLLLALSLGFTVPLLWRRSHPAAVLLTMTPVALLNAWSGAILQAAMLQLLVVFHIALRLSLRTLSWAALHVLTPVAVSAIRYGDQPTWEQQIGAQLMSVAVAALIGITVRTRRDHTEVLEDRARRLETERDQQVRLAAAAERARIAREMHDIIGHNLSVITGLADGGRYAAAKSPDRAAQALDAIGTTSRQALGELRRLLDVLRDDAQDGAAAELAPQPALTDLDRLLDGVRRAGLPVQRFGFRMLLESQDDMTVVGEATDGAEATRMTAELHPDVVLMDVRMPGLDGIEATRRIVAGGGRSRVLILTTFDLDEYAYSGLRAGASGFLVKDAQPEELLSGIRAVATGDAVVAPSLTRRLLDAYVHHLPATAEPNGSPDSADPRLAPLT
ncbi:response regulator [Streptomyces coelicoflavus]|uniref:response regulator n=1 Tax=Streptomyces coelicoflavus TaxID=285562 RepID=UPI003F4A5E50